MAVSPSSVYRVLSGAGLLRKWHPSASSKGNGFIGPLRAHQHWHIDISYLNIRGTFYYLCSLLDGYSRYIVHWEIRESMTEADVEIILQRGREKFPKQKPRIISDNGPQFIARDFKEFIRINGMSHVKNRRIIPRATARLNAGIKASKESASVPDARYRLRTPERSLLILLKSTIPSAFIAQSGI